jgi:rhodanese-related sulfurtransferase
MDAFTAAVFRTGRFLTYSRRADGHVNKRNPAPIIMLLLAATVLLPGGCGGKSISDRDLVLLDPQEGMQLVEGRKKLLGLGGAEKCAWVDPRSARKYRDGHIPGAIHLPFQKLSEEEDRLRGFDVLIVYGDGFKDDLAGGMSKRLLELGFKDVRTLRGGLKAWTRADLELETGDPPRKTQP